MSLYSNHLVSCHWTSYLKSFFVLILTQKKKEITKRKKKAKMAKNVLFSSVRATPRVSHSQESSRPFFSFFGTSAEGRNQRRKRREKKVLLFCPRTKKKEKNSGAYKVTIWDELANGHFPLREKEREKREEREEKDWKRDTFMGQGSRLPAALSYLDR